MKWIKKVAATPLEAIAKVIDSLNGGDNERTNAPSIKAVNDALDLKQDFLNFDTKPTSGSTNPVESGGLLNYLKGEFLDVIYPVGSIYLSANYTNPSTLFGGVWTREEGYYLYAAGAGHGINTKGGSVTATFTPEGTVAPHELTLDEIPEHSHTYTDTFGRVTQSSGTGSSAGVHDMTSVTNQTSQMGGGGGHTHDFEGIATNVEINPLWYAVAVWRRIS